MISNHLSMVEQLRPKSNELAAQVEQYLAAGGKIEEAESCNYKPKPTMTTLLGRATTEAAAPARNLGALEIAVAKAGKPLPAHTIGAVCGKDGYLNIGEPPAGFGTYVLPGNNYHVYDYNLFWANIRADAEARVNAFQAAALAPAGVDPQ